MNDLELTLNLTLDLPQPRPTTTLGLEGCKSIPRPESGVGRPQSLQPGADEDKKAFLRTRGALESVSPCNDPNFIVHSHVERNDN